MLEIDRVVDKKVLQDGEEKKVHGGNYKWEIVWTNVIVLVLLHVGAVYGFFLRNNAGYKIYILGKSVGVLSGLGVTAGVHRYWCHRTYKANKFVQILYMCIFSMTIQNSIYTWCRDHRLHHKHSETDADPHNANRGFFFSHIGWLMVRKHEQVKEKGKELDMSDLENDPIVAFHHKYYLWLVFFFTFAMPMFIGYVVFEEPLNISFFSLILYRYVLSLHFTWSINSIAHMYGNKPYDKSIGPTDTTLMKICAFGEGFHNYHHTFPWDYRSAEVGGHASNLTTYLIDGFARLGWVWDRKTVKQELVERKAERMGDGTRKDPPRGFLQKAIGKVVDEKTGQNFLLWMYLLIFLYVL